MSNLIPIVNAPSFYVNGYNVDNFPAHTESKQLAISAGAARDSTNTFDIISNVPLFLNVANNGANGLDTGTVAASTRYFIYVISDPTNVLPTACIASLTDNGPLMPSVNGITYGAWTLIDTWFVNGSSNFTLANQFSRNSNYMSKQYSSPFTVLSGGTSGSAGVNLDPYVPINNYGLVTLQFTFHPTAAGQTFFLNNFYSVGGNVFHFTSLVASQPHEGQVEITPESVPGNHIAISYGVSAGSLDLKVVGFDYYL